jgi:hypothetical protein
MTASGPDITRSAVGRLEAESLWLPSALIRNDVQWIADDARHAVATFRHADILTAVRFRLWISVG